jgi:hypothetical protein
MLALPQEYNARSIQSYEISLHKSILSALGVLVFFKEMFLPLQMEVLCINRFKFHHFTMLDVVHWIKYYKFSLVKLK